MYEYDCIVMTDASGWTCVANNLIVETPNEAEDTHLAHHGYFFRDVSATEVHVIVNRLDLDALQTASDAFYAMYS